MSHDFETRLERLRGWRGADGPQRIAVIDAHTAGEPLRVIVGGFPELSGTTILARRREARENSACGEPWQVERYPQFLWITLWTDRRMRGLAIELAGKTEDLRKI